MPSSASAAAARAAWRRPRALSSVSSWPCMRISAFQTVSPWRTATMRVTRASVAPRATLTEGAAG
jgi:hypothetical protein